MRFRCVLGSSWKFIRCGIQQFFLMTAVLSVGGYGNALAADTTSSTTSESSLKRLIPDDLFGVTFPDSLHGWASGYYGTVIRTNDGGVTWTHQTIDGAQLLRRIDFVDTHNGWTIGHRGSVYSTKDGGKNWQEKILKKGLYLRSVDFVSAQVGWVVGQDASIFFTSDGGENWVKQPLSEYKGRDLPRLNDVVAIDAKTAIAVGEFGIVIYTTDGGKIWHIAPSTTETTLTAVAAYDNHIIVAGLDGVILTAKITEERLTAPRLLPVNTKQSFFDIALDNQGDGYAVGRATAFQIRDGKFSLATLDSPYGRPSNWLGAIALLPDGGAFLVGKRGIVLSNLGATGSFSLVHSIGVSAPVLERLSND